MNARALVWSAGLLFWLAVGFVLLIVTSVI